MCPKMLVKNLSITKNRAIKTAPTKASKHDIKVLSIFNMMIHTLACFFMPIRHNCLQLRDHLISYYQAVYLRHAMEVCFVKISNF